MDFGFLNNIFCRFFFRTILVWVPLNKHYIAYHKIFRVENSLILILRAQKDSLFSKLKKNQASTTELWIIYQKQSVWYTELVSDSSVAKFAAIEEITPCVTRSNNFTVFAARRLVVLNFVARKLSRK